MLLFKIKTKIRRFLVNFLKLNRPTSYPFITSCGFRSLAQHFLDEISDIEPEHIEKNDIVFVRGDFLIEFFEKKHPKIKNKYILISRDADINIDKKYEKYIDDKIIHWFAQHLLFEHKKITPIPSGVASYYESHIGGRGSINVLQNCIDNVQKKIKDKISFGFSTSGYVRRLSIENKLKKDSKFEKIEPTNNQSEYFTKLSQYNFTISPEGVGIDCYRNWESFYLKVIPIVEKSFAVDYFYNIGLPLMIVKNYDELDNFDEKKLLEKYTELQSGFENPALYMNYWIDLILNMRIK